MKKFASLLLAFAMTVGMLTGCGGDSGTSSTGEAPAQEVTVAISSTFATLDPALISTTHMAHVYGNMGSNFYRTDANGVLQYDLGESMEKSEDGLTYTFTIKEGLKWSDGEPLTAEHFVYGIKRAIGYGPDNAYTKKNLVNFIAGAEEAANAAMDVADMTNVGVTALDDTTFQVTLSTPCPYFERIFSGNVTSPMRPDFALEHDSSWSVNGTYPSSGPMALESISPEEEAVLVKNENYWDAENVTLEKATFVVMTDSTAQVNAFRTGDIDIAMSVPSEVATNAEYESNIVMPEKYVSNYFVLINSGPKAQVEALKDENVRKALALAIDKDTMLNILGGKANVRLDGYIPYGFEGVDGNDFRDEKSYGEFNLEEAKSLMEAAGYNENNHLKFEYLYSNSQFHADVAQILQQMWSQIYVDVELKSIEMGVFYDYIDNGDFTTCRYANNDSTDPLSYFQLFTTDSQIDGCQAITDPVLDQMVEEAYQIIDHDEYIAKLHEIEDYFVEEKQYVIPLLTQNSVVLVQDGIEGLWLTVGGSPIVYNISVK
ncbi:peptide ABC transporter substrate-binding protein [Hydrogenoanaerobacterium saccharovorans]|uniref:Peptide ABC transporter substrate-binding protein n=1 Tax=Hydrogenoanaerobacterium saccharovorans TaxID=474960 RepID=A0ABS2GKR1_9FIRM|nr:peptide ABC transporter substrate-binding protein [Hydrogenoanaerobacterium saccharovorans]MBM6922294.1 peptide ABC transporter substrate-binding protein [Hydrogenoanaerobacterium saccharovorans]